MSELIRGIMALVLLSVALGQYPRLEHWARREAIRALVWEPTPPFFPETYRALFPDAGKIGSGALSQPKKPKQAARHL